MLTTIQGIYDNGKIILTEEPPEKETKAEVLITFLPKKISESSEGKRKLGGLEGKVSIPDDFNEPLEDLKDYM